MGVVYLKPTGLVGRFGDLMLVQNDLESAYAYLSAISGMNNDQLMSNGLAVKAFWIAAVIAYAKGFCSSGPGRIMLDANRMVEKELLPIHEKMMGWRDKYVAHREHPSYEAIRVFVELDESTDSKGPVFLNNEYLFLIKPSREELQKSIELIQQVNQKIKTEIQELGKKIFDKCKSKQPSEWYQNVGKELDII